MKTKLIGTFLPIKDLLELGNEKKKISLSKIYNIYQKNFESQSGVGAFVISLKKPLIVTDVGGLPDFVRNKRAIANPNDSEDMARKITKVQKNKKILEKLSIDIIKPAKKYNWDDIVKKTSKIYSEMLSICL